MNIQEQVIEIVVVHLSLEFADVTPESNLIEIGADSLDMVEIAMEVESTFDIDIPEEESEWNTVGDIIAYVKGRKGEA